MKKNKACFLLLLNICFIAAILGIIGILRLHKISESEGSLSSAPTSAPSPTGTLMASADSSGFRDSLSPTPLPDVVSSDSAKQTEEPVSVSETPSITPTPTPTALPVREENTPASISICLAGDLMCLAGQQYAAATSDGSHDYSGSFSLLTPILQKYNLVAGNLETILSESNPYVTELAKITPDCPNCNAPADYLKSVKDAGFDVIATANNHCLDGGLVGIDETIAHLTEYDILFTGTCLSTQTSENRDRYLVLDIDGFRIGLVAFTELINLRESVSQTELNNSVNVYSRALATTLISEMRNAGAEYIIVYTHWGSENTHEVRDYQRRHAQEIAEAGADVIVGSHPHCLQGFEIIKTNSARQVPCFYSLGNLISSMSRDINNDTVLLDITLSRMENNEITQQISYLPCHVFGYLNGFSHVIVPVTAKLEKENHRTELSEAEARIREVLVPLS